MVQGVGDLISWSLLKSGRCLQVARLFSDDREEKKRDDCLRSLRSLTCTKYERIR